MPLLTSSGVNIVPPSIRSALPSGEIGAEVRVSAESAEDFRTSSLHLGMTISASMGGQTLSMAATPDGCGSQCRTKGGANITTLEANGQSISTVEVEIVRFAKTGRAAYMPTGPRGVLVSLANAARRAFGVFASDAPKPLGATWLVHMEDGFPLTGTVEAQVLADPPRPGRLRLGGKMVITMQRDYARDPIRFRSRAEPVIEGIVQAWPPRSSTLRLRNPPIEYFDEREIDLPEARPVLVIQSNEIAFGNLAVTLLEVQPAVTRLAHVGTVGSSDFGVRIEWMDVRESVRAAGDPPVRWYCIYRKFENDNVNGWLAIRRVPSSLTAWVDLGNNGREAASYVVLAAAEYPFGYLYESAVKEVYEIGRRA